jgi:hypothetical protein
MNALVLHLGPLRPGARFPDAAWLVEQGVDVTMVVSRLPVGAYPPGQVTVVEAGDLEQVSLLVRAERFFVMAAPAATMRRLRAVVSKMGATRGIGRPARVVLRLVVALHSMQYRVSRVVHGRWSSGPYRVFRSILLWRWLRRGAMHVLAAQEWDVVVCQDRDSVATAWHLARRLPNADVTYGVNRLRPVWQQRLELAS